MTPYYSKDGIVLFCGDNREVLPTLEAESVHACVTDPPYGLTPDGKTHEIGHPSWTPHTGEERKGRKRGGFMGKEWDHGVPGVEFWTNVLRVLKPGGHLLAFGGTRTYHRLAVAIEDAGFEIRDCIMWVYGSGFSKGFNLKREPICSCIPAGNPLPCDHEQNTKHNVRPLRNGDLQEAQPDGKERGKVLFSLVPEQSVQSHETTRPKQEAGRGEQPGMEGGEVHRARQGLCDDPQAGASASEAERLRSGAHTGCGEDAGATVGGQRRGASQEQKQGRQQAGESAGVFESSGTLDDGTLCGRGQCPRCGKLKAEFEGWSSQLKPAYEPIIVARKPLDGTVAANVLKHGCGGINVDGCRIGTGESRIINSNPGMKGGKFAAGEYESNSFESRETNAGRWPANFIHDGSEEVLRLFPENAPSRGGAAFFRDSVVFGPDSRQNQNDRHEIGFGDSGSAARFFYTAKADSSERRQSKHPTVKPLDLMRYLVRLVCPEGGIVLDPFMGSGSTIEAARDEHCKAIGVDLSTEYCADAVERLRQGVLNFGEVES